MTTNDNIAALFEQRKHQPQWNTSYPLRPDHWARYRWGGDELSFDGKQPFVGKQPFGGKQVLPFDGEQELSMYVHVPFCKRLCSFCEYTRMVLPDEATQTHYVDVVRSDIRHFREQMGTFRLAGFDIGGGTPMALSDHAFGLLLDVYDEAVDGLLLAADYEPSIEGTFASVSRQKLERVAASGVRRLSLGLQTTSGDVLCRQNRAVESIASMARVLDMAAACGMSKVNVDLMYGLPGQTQVSIAADISILGTLRPQEVTLYELRTNMIACKALPSKDVLFAQYAQLFEALTAMGYHARFGQNTFSLSPVDGGVSSYLRSRMLHGTSYRGFGVSAQSMSRRGVAYNVGKSASADSLKKILPGNSYAEQDVYLLPPAEWVSKYVSIAAYNGAFSLRRIEEAVGKEAMRPYLDVLRFCLAENLMTVDDANNWVRITPHGFKHYGAVFSLFT